VVADSRRVEPGDLFVAIPGARVDGGEFAAAALRAGAWGVLARPAWAREAAATGDRGVVIASGEPVAALGALARAWRRDLAAHVIAVTGSVGKTSTKDLIAALIAPHRTVAASRANFNTEIGLPLEVLAAPPGTEVLVLELAMRGFGQIAELTAICEPDVAVITNVGPVHLEQMGSLEGVAKAKAELLEGMRDGGTAIVPSDEPLLEPYLREALDVVTFGPGGDVTFEGSSLRGGTVPDAPPERYAVLANGERVQLELPFESQHNLRNTLAAVAAARAVGVRPGGRVDVRFSALRGERVALGRGATVVNDCYNANPLSMRAAAAVLADRLVRAGDVVLVKASRGVGLEVVTEALAAEAGG
jgi:UDP-N-acetylmuramoyl-tripeptide--D-alanyl-D-alanine ligase